MSDPIVTDVLVIGAGPAGLATALALKRRAGEKKPRVMVLDKGRGVGSHILSGAIVDPKGFEGLLTPAEVANLTDEKFRGHPVETTVNKESFRLITSPTGSMKIPWVPPLMHSKGFPVGSLTKIVGYLATLAEKDGVEIYPGYAVTALIEDASGRVVGARTGEKGVDKKGAHKANYLAGEEIRAKVVVLAEGGSGILTEKLVAEKHLEGVRPQTYALAIKELVEVPAGTQHAGEVMHTFGYPADSKTYGGGFVYHVNETNVMVGYAYALDYRKAEVNPHELFRRFKATAAIQAHIKDGKSVAYGAKVIPEGGYYSALTPYTPGCVIVGDSAGLLDSLRIKGVHLALESGAAAADAILAELATGKGLETYPARLHATKGWKEIKRVRNVRAAFSFGTFGGVIAAGLAWITFGAFPFWRVGGLEGDAQAMKPLRPGALEKEKALNVPASPTAVDRLTDVFMSGTIHDEDQPCHLKIRDPKKCDECAKVFGSPCTRFCSAEVYRRDGDKLEIDFSNCLHCKTCRIKCPYGNVDWTFPQGGDGPRYTRM